MTITADALRDRIDDVLADMERQFGKLTPEIEVLIAEVLKGDRTAYGQLQSVGRTLMAPMIDRYGLATGALTAEWYDLNRELLKVGGNWSGATLQYPNTDTGPLIGGTLEQFVTVQSVLDGLQAGMDLRVRQTSQGTVMDSVLRDTRARGWGRVASIGCCSFCGLLASRGAVYRTQSTATFMPHLHCVPGWTPVAATSVEYATRRWYAGEMVTIQTERGQKLTITPNHSVLTEKGWVPAGFLREGDGVFGGLDADRVVLRVPDEQHRVTGIEDYWGALRMVGRLSRVPLAAEDFHGDASEGEVDVVSIDRHLAPERYPRLGQPLREQALALGVTELARPFAGLCAEHLGLVRAVRAANGVMRSRNEAAALGRSEIGHALTHRRALVTERLARLDEHALHGPSGAPILLGERLDAHTGTVERNQLADFGSIGNPPRESVGIRFDAPDIKFAADGLRVHAEIGRNLIDRLSGLVTSDRIVSVERSEFRGHVFNLSTDEGWYSAAGLIVSNCHCQAIPMWETDPTGTALRSREDTIATRRSLTDKQRARQNEQARVWMAQNSEQLGLI